MKNSKNSSLSFTDNRIAVLSSYEILTRDRNFVIINIVII